MSRLIPPQFGKFGYTFWIPSQVEPTVAIIGCALPALRTPIADSFSRMSSALSSFTSGKTSYTTSVSKDGSSRQHSQKKYLKMGGGASTATSQLRFELEHLESRG